MAKDKSRLTTNFGAPVDDDQNTMNAGDPGPVLIQDVHLLEKLAHFDRERIPARRACQGGGRLRLLRGYA